MSAAVSQARWEVAQAAETRYWSSLVTDAHEFGRVLVEKATIAGRIARSIGAHALLGDVVEIGIGPLGIGCMHFLEPRPLGTLIGIEPLPLLAPEDMNAPAPLRAVATACHHMNYRHVCASGEATGLRSESCALVISYNVLDHVRDPAAVLAEAHRILVPGGTLALGCDTVSLATRLRYDLYLARRRATELGVQAHTFRFSARGLENLVRSAGFDILSFEERRLRPFRDVAGRSQRILLIAERST